MSAQDLDTCPHCEGVGAYWDDQTGQPDEPNGGRMVTCETCKGDKVVDTRPCIACGAPSYDHDEGCPVAEAEERRQDRMYDVLAELIERGQATPEEAAEYKRLREVRT